MSDFDKFAITIEKKKLKQIYLIHGNEDYFISRAVELLSKQVIEPAQQSFNLDIIDGQESGSEEVLSSALSFPFIGDRRLTIVKKFDRMEKKHRLDVAEHLGGLPETTILCLVAGEIKAAEEPYKKITGLAEVLDFNRLKSSDLTDFLVKYARTAGRELEPGNADFLVELTGDSLGDLISEIDKLSLYVGDRKKITFEDINAVVGKSRTHNIFELQRAIGKRDAKKAQEIAGRMLESGEKAVYINFMLSRFFLNLIQVRHLSKRGTNTNEISQKVFDRWNPFINEYISAAKLYSDYDLKNAVGVLLDVDVKLKSGGYEGPDALCVIIAEVVETHARNPA